MNRDQIKIIEFGMEDDGPPRPAAAGAGGMKIIEFDNEPRDGAKRIATARDVGRIKIVEFDDDARARKAAVAEPPADRPRKPFGPVKIKEFDKEKEAEGAAPPGAAPRIKIMEFD